MRARRPGGIPQCAVPVVPDERGVPDLGEALGGGEVGDEPPDLLAVGEAGADRRRRDDGGMPA